MRRYIRQSGRSFWTIGLGFAAGVIFVAVASGLRVPSMPGQAGSLLRKSEDTQMRHPAKPESPVPENPISSLDEALTESVAAPPTPEQGRECIKKITDRNMFSRARTTASGGGIHGGSRTETRANEPLPFRLVGTVVLNKGDSYAVLEFSETKAQDVYRVGQTIGDARIESIEQNEVVVLHDGSRRTLGLVLTGHPSTEAGLAAVPVSTQTGPEELVRVVANGNRQINTAVASSQARRAAQSFLRKIKLSPSDDGAGLCISGLGDSTMAKLVGLRDGDVIQAVNNHPVANRRQAVQVLKKAHQLGRAQLTVVRDQQPRSLAFQTDSW